MCGRLDLNVFEICGALQKLGNYGLQCVGNDNYNLAAGTLKQWPKTWICYWFSKYL